MGKYSASADFERTDRIYGVPRRARRVPRALPHPKLPAPTCQGGGAGYTANRQGLRRSSPYPGAGTCILRDMIGRHGRALRSEQPGLDSMAGHRTARFPLGGALKGGGLPPAGSMVLTGRHVFPRGSAKRWGGSPPCWLDGTAGRRKARSTLGWARRCGVFTPCWLDGR